MKPLKTAIFISSGAVLLCLALLGAGAPKSLFGQQYCSQRFGFCLDYPAAMFSQAYFSSDEDSILLRTNDGMGELSITSTPSTAKLDSHRAFEQRLRALSDRAAGQQPTVLSIINGDDYYEVNFLLEGHWYHQKAGFFRTHDVLFSAKVPVNRTDLMMRLKEDVSIEF